MSCHENLPGQTHHRRSGRHRGRASAGEHYEVKRFTKFGFEWTYEGDSPQQLALAILVDYLGDNARAIRLSEPFMKQIVANLDNYWQLTGDEIGAAVRNIDAG